MEHLAEIALAVVLGLLVVYLVVGRQRSIAASQVAGLAGGKGPKAKKVREFKTYTREEVAKHSARGDVWTVITDKRSGEKRVYDLTEYVEEHPGGDSILNNAGGDSTEGFHGPQHPDTVFEMVKEFCIGKVDE